MNSLVFVESEDETNCDRLRRIVAWMDNTPEYEFDGKTIKQIIERFDREAKV